MKWLSVAIATLAVSTASLSARADVPNDDCGTEVDVACEDFNGDDGVCKDDGSGDVYCDTNATLTTASATASGAGGAGGGAGGSGAGGGGEGGGGSGGSEAEGGGCQMRHGRTAFSLLAAATLSLVGALALRRRERKSSASAR